MPTICSHENFMQNLQAFLRQVAVDTGMNQPKDANMLQFVIGLGAGIGPNDLRMGLPIKMEFHEYHESIMKTVIHLTEPGMGHNEAQRIASYFNKRHAANVAVVEHVPYLKGRHEHVVILSGALREELDIAKEYQEIFRGSLLKGAKALTSLPVAVATKAELNGPGAHVAFVPCPKAGPGYHALEFSGISEAAQLDIVAAINAQYGEGSVNYVRQ